MDRRWGDDVAAVAAQIEPAVKDEWTRLIKFYATGQGAQVDDGKIATAMIWQEPARDVRVARARAVKLSKGGHLFCVWTGKRVFSDSLNIDHCFPWKAWPNNEKSAQLPSDALLRAARDRIIRWWEAAYNADVTVVSERFWLEAKSSLPGIRRGETTMNDLFDAVCIQRMKLANDQQVPEWEGKQYIHA